MSSAAQKLLLPFSGASCGTGDGGGGIAAHEESNYLRERLGALSSRLAPSSWDFFINESPRPPGFA